MKTFAALVFSFLSLTVFGTSKTISIKGLASVDLLYEEFENFNIKIVNNSTKQIEISVYDTLTMKQMKGFGLNGKCEAEISVEKGRKLKISNTSKNDITVLLEFIPKKSSKTENNDTYITFTLHNSSAKAIALIIPSVMNPNLTPFSNSGVSLKIGQEIFFKYKGKQTLLFTVNESIKNGDKIDVAELIRNYKE